MPRATMAARGVGGRPALVAAVLIAGAGGVVAMGAALGLRYALGGRRWERLALGAAPVG